MSNEGVASYGVVSGMESPLYKSVARGDSIPSTPPPIKNPPMITLSPNEITTAQQLLANYAPAQETLAILTANNGDFADCLDRLSKSPTFNDPSTKKSLWETTINVLRQELCSDEGWRGKVKEYSKAPASAAASIISGSIRY